MIANSTNAYGNNCHTNKLNVLFELLIYDELIWKIILSTLQVNLIQKYREKKNQKNGKHENPKKKFIQLVLILKSAQSTPDFFPSIFSLLGLPKHTPQTALALMILFTHFAIISIKL